ncbi:MAG: HAMP domain-containing sensor histidine kinase, partial [Bacteroidota bacterium]
EEAIAFQKRSKELNEHYGNHLHVQHDLNSLCSLYMQVGRLDSARFYAELASQHAKSYANLDQKKYLALILSSLEERAGNYQEALQHHKTYASLFLSAYTEKAQALQKNEEVRQNVAEVKAEKDEVEREKELLSDLNQLYFALAFALGIILLLVIFVLYNLRQNKQILEHKNAELSKLNSTKDKFFGIIAHDLRNPLIALDWVSEQMNIYLKRKNIDRLYRLAEHTETTAKRLSALLDNLLNWSLVQTGSIPYDPAHVDLSQITEEILELYRPLAQAKGIELNNDIRDSAEVFADERAVHMIIRNLIGNALKFTQNEGKVIISNERENGHQQIIITDSGRGISPDLLPNLFSLDKKLSMGKAQEKGSGLGLMLCKELVELNKGEIRASSEIGKGSRFVISLPAV